MQKYLLTFHFMLFLFAAKAQNTICLKYIQSDIAGEITFGLIDQDTENDQLAKSMLALEENGFEAVEEAEQPTFVSKKLGLKVIANAEGIIETVWLYGSQSEACQNEEVTPYAGKIPRYLTFEADKKAVRHLLKSQKQDYKKAKSSKTAISLICSMQGGSYLLGKMTTPVLVTWYFNEADELTSISVVKAAAEQ